MQKNVSYLIYLKNIDQLNLLIVECIIASRSDIYQMYSWNFHYQFSILFSITFKDNLKLK